MRKQRSDGQATRQRLLDAAAKVFATKGFRDASNADVCELADANTAAVNYHFDSKENLYVQAWRHSFEQSLAAHSPDGGVPADATPEERLRGRILAIVRRIADRGNHMFEIVHREMASPTGLLDEVMCSAIRPLHEDMATVVSELLGPHAPPQQALFCVVSIVGQCFALMRSRGAPCKHPGPHLRLTDAEAFAEHIFTFSVAGIRAVREASTGGNK
jgi:TetR/AcrR family transcriptional regulator, regulator of cefoperazone and chloramphenicol sensitivity